MPLRIPAGRGTFQLLLIIGIAGLLVLLVWAPISLVVQSFLRDSEWTLEPWRGVWVDGSRWGPLLGNTILVAGVAVAVAMLMGSMLAALIFRSRWRGRRLLLGSILVWLCVPPFVIDAAFFNALGLEHARGWVVFAGLLHGIAAIPAATVLVGVGLARLAEPDVEEAALLECSALRTFLHVTLVRMTWCLAGTAGIIFWLVASDYSITDVLGIRCFAEEIYTQYQLHGERTQPLIVALPLVILFGVGFYVLNRRAHFLASPLFQSSASDPHRYTLPKCVLLLAWTGFLGTAAVGVWLLGRLFVHIESLDQLRGALSSFRSEWWISVQVAFWTGLLAALAGFVIAWLRTQNRVWGLVIGLCVLILLSIPAPSLAMAINSFFNRVQPEWLANLLWPIYNSLWMYVLTLLIRWLPLAFLIVLPAVQRIPASMIDAARCDGANWYDRFVSVYWPACRGSILLAGLMVAILTIGELNCAYLVAPPGRLTLSSWYFTFIHYGITPEVAAVCLAGLLTVLVPSLVVFALLRRGLVMHARNEY